MTCLRGVAAVENQVLQKVSSNDLRVYIVWLPILDGESREDARAAASDIDDARATHFWDADLSLARSLGDVLSIPPREPSTADRHGVAWDVYLAYPRHATWQGSAPPPTFWMHQLQQVEETQAPELDGAALRAHVEDLLRPRPPAR